MRKAYFAVAIATVALIVACSGSSESGIPAGGGTGTSSGTTASGGTSGGTSGSGTSGGTSGGGTSGGGTSGGGTSSGGVDGGKEAGATPCTWAKVDPCGANKYCSTKGVGNGCQQGVCLPITTTETNNKAVVCGCDGISYWNESVAAKHGMSTRKQPGECGNSGGGGGSGEPVTCGGLAAIPCPSNAICNHRVAGPDGCNISDVGGTCWHLPAQCPVGLPQVASRPCGLVLPQPACKEECALIRGEQPWYPDTCP